MFLCARGYPAMPDESHHPEIARLHPGHYETLKLISRQTLDFECTATLEMPMMWTLSFPTFNKLF